MKRLIFIIIFFSTVIFGMEEEQQNDSCFPFMFPRQERKSSPTIIEMVTEEKKEEADAKMEELSKQVTEYYFRDRNTTTGKTIVMRKLPPHLRKSEHVVALSELFLQRDSSDDEEEASTCESPSLSQSDERMLGRPEIRDEIHSMMVSTIEESFTEKERESEEFRRRLLSSRSKYRLALVGAITTTITTISSSVVAIIVALKS